MCTQKGEVAHVELGHRPYPINPYFDLIQHPPIKHPREHQVIRPFLGVQPGEEERRVVLGRKELERGGIVERVNLVLPREIDGVRSFERVLDSSQG